jgi:hypothetical protein
MVSWLVVGSREVGQAYVDNSDLIHTMHVMRDRVSWVSG